MIGHRRSSSHAQRHLLGTVVTVAVGLLVWFLLGLTDISALKLPRIGGVMASLTEQPAILAQYSAATFVRVLVGLVVGGVAGWSVGLAMAYSSTLRAAIEPMAEMFRPLSPILLIPFAILWLGLGALSQIVLIGIGTFMVLLVGTYEAARSVPERYVKTAVSLGATPRSAFLRTVIPYVFGNHLLGTTRVAAGTGFGLTVAAEYLGAQGGLGYLARNARVTLDTEIIALASILIAIEAIVLDQAIRWVWRARTRWVARTTDQTWIG